MEANKGHWRPRSQCCGPSVEDNKGTVLLDVEVSLWGHRMSGKSRARKQRGGQEAFTKAGGEPRLPWASPV